MTDHMPPIFPDDPFSGQGVSLYVNGKYRDLRIIPQDIWLKQGNDWPVGEASVPKTARIASDAETGGNVATMTPDLSAYNGQTITLDVRHYKNNVEALTVHPQTITLDGSGNTDNVIRGAFAAMNPEIRAGGIVRIKFHWVASSQGIQPETFKISRTAGPTSPADISETAVGTGIYEIDTLALSDSSAYTYDIIAVNTTLSVNRTLGAVTFTADATGPPAPLAVAAEAY